MSVSRWFVVALVVGAASLAGCKPSVCGNSLCEFGEGCGTCSIDCGSCGRCGDGICGGTESSSSCPGDCGGSSDPYEGCITAADCFNSRDICLRTTNRGVTRGFCTVSSCPGPSVSADDTCEFDMFGSRGDCLSFGTGDGFNCYHRCTTSADCYAGFGCYTPTGASGALTQICLPE